MKGKKNVKYKNNQITTIYIFGFKLHFTRKQSLKKSCLHLNSCLCTVFIRARYLKYSNDTLKLNIHQYMNYNIIEIYMIRLSTTTQIFIAMDYSIMMSLRITQKHFTKTFFSHPVEVPGSMYFGNIFQIMFLRFLKYIYKNLKEIEIFQAVSKLAIFVNL